MSLDLPKRDPDDERPPYIQVASIIRAAILTKKFAPGDKLPSQAQLAEHFELARPTIQRALEELDGEGLTVARQGSGVFVRSKTQRPAGLRPRIERAFEAEAVTIDFAGFSGETLDGALQEPLDQIRVGRVRPQSIRLRLLVPDFALPQAVPVRTSDHGHDDRLTDRAQDILRRHCANIVNAVEELQTLDLVPEVDVQVKLIGSMPFFKLYVINGEDAFFGFYPVRPNRTKLKGETVEFFDVLGRDSILFPYESSDVDRTSSTEFVQQAQMWFDSIWDTVGKEYTP